MPIKKLKTSLSPQWARYPPESAADLSLDDVSRDSSSWQTVQPRLSAMDNRQSSRASRVIPETAARVVLPAVMRDIMTSSASPVPSKSSESSELPTLLEFPLPSGS